MTLEEMKQLHNYSCTPIAFEMGAHESYEYFVPHVQVSKLTKSASSLDYEVIHTSSECNEWIYDHDFGYVSMTSEVGLMRTRMADFTLFCVCSLGKRLAPPGSGNAGLSKLIFSTTTKHIS